jgi:hypothetical protein
MDMVGHHDEGAQIDGIMMRQIEPSMLNDFPQPVQSHFTIYDLSKQRHTSLGNHGDEIQARLSVIISVQPQGWAAMGLKRRFWVIHLPVKAA